jgi:hypothetical protein
MSFGSDLDEYFMGAPCSQILEASFDIKAMVKL